MTASPADDLASAERRIQELTNELAEEREQRTATAEILRVISSSPTDPQRVFSVIAASAARLCDAYDALIRQVDGEVLRIVGHHGPIPAAGTLPLTRGLPPARAILDRRTIHITDLLTVTDEFPEGSDRARSLGFRTILAVPLIHASEAIGVISIRRAEVRPFTDRQIELLKTFADQAVIAIENARLFEAEQIRTREVEAKSAELTQILEYQTAISEVLAVISRSPTDLQPVFDSIVETSARLLHADRVVIRCRRGDDFRVVAELGHPSDVADYLRRTPVQPGPGSIAGRAAVAKAAVQMEDMQTDPENSRQDIVRVTRVRSGLAVPLMREGEVIGVLVLGRLEKKPFVEREISLLETFADQAVIAIENTRLFEAEQASKRELQESLEYQTATSEVLNVISRSPTDVQPVFNAIARSAASLCKARYCNVFRYDGQSLYFAAAHGTSAETQSELRRRSPFPPSRGFAAGRAILTNKIEEIPDIKTDPDYALGDIARARSAVGVP